MDNLLRKIESDEVVIYTDHVYSSKILKKCRNIHEKLVEEGKIEGAFDDEKWMGYSDIKKYGIDFSLDEMRYGKHIGKVLGITVGTMKDMLRCYAIYCIGVYIYQTIALRKIKLIKDFLVRYKDIDFKLKAEEITTIEDFLGFIETPDKQIEQIISNIRLEQSAKKTQRQLAPIINYLVIENEINHIYENCDDETFKKWFPIYFWVNITFVLPLRSTEMLVTPKKCIYREDGKVFLRIRRTMLKKGNRTIYYDVKKDYKEFRYEIPDTEIVQNIEKYMEMTEKQERRFLFAINDMMVDDMLSLVAFNNLLAAFVTEHIIGNKRYDFAKYASGIKEFEKVTAGDSRPIAMANLYFQNAGEDICRQLADHTNITTSAGYYTNISETIWASSIIQLQKKLDKEWRYTKEKYEQNLPIAVAGKKSICVSQKRIEDKTNLSDCIEQGHLAECMGCKFYRPTKSELDSFLELQKKKADKSAKLVHDFMNHTLKTKEKELTLEEIFLSVQTEASRCRMGCDIKAKEKWEEWQNVKNTQTIYY